MQAAVAICTTLLTSMYVIAAVFRDVPEYVPRRGLKDPSDDSLETGHSASSKLIHAPFVPFRTNEAAQDPPQDLPQDPPPQESPQSDPVTVTVMTYNLCYGCMTDDPAVAQAHGSALARGCIALKCLARVATTIAKIGPDVLLLQEATGWDRIKAAVPVLAGHTWSGAMIGDEALVVVTPPRYEVLGTVAGNEVPSIKTGRRFMIVVAQDTAARQTVVFVNVHRSHGIVHGRVAMAKNFSTAIDTLGPLGSLGFGFGSGLASGSASGLASMGSMGSLAVVCGGDFNDEGLGLWKGSWRPFQHCQSPALAAARVSMPKPPPRTCCDASDHSAGAFKGTLAVCDYIMSDAVFVRANEIAARVPWTSDHLPVVAGLSL